MDLDVVHNLIGNGQESAILEFKKSTAKLKGAAQTLCAFLNGEGGHVIIGITDNAKFVGQDVTDQTKLEIANTLKKFEPSANITVDYVSLVSGKHLIVLGAVPDQQVIPYTFDGRSYERQESETHLMAQPRYQQLLLSRNMNPPSWESQIAKGISFDDLDKKELMQTLTEIRNTKRLDSILNQDGIKDSLIRLQLLENQQLTNAATVLFVKELTGNYMQCVIRMARFKGTAKGNFLDSRHIFGNSFQLLREAENFINRNTAVASHFAEGKFAREDRPEYPFEAVREALVNAICHRDYASPGGSVTISIYDDRLEIANFGTLPSQIKIEDLKKPHTSHPRNPRIVNVFYRRNLIEAMGTGTQKIIQSCLNANMKEPEFFEQAGNFVVRIWSRYYKKLIDDKWSELTDRQVEILEILKQKKLAPSEILQQFKESISDRTLRRELQILKRLGYVDAEGKQGWGRKWFLVNK